MIQDLRHSVRVHFALMTGSLYIILFITAQINYFTQNNSLPDLFLQIYMREDDVELKPNSTEANECGHEERIQLSI